MAHPTGSEWQTSDPEGIRLFQSDPLCGKPFSNEMTYSVIKGFHDLWLAQNESCIPAELPILIIAGTDDPVGGKTVTIQGLITRYMKEATSPWTTGSTMAAAMKSSTRQRRTMSTATSGIG